MRNVRTQGTILATVMGVVSCGGETPTGGSPPPPAPPPAQVASIEVDYSRVGLFPGETLGMGARARDSDGRRINAVLEWSSSDPSIVEASPISSISGRLVALASGEAVLTVRSGEVEVTVPVSVASLADHNVVASGSGAHPFEEEPILARDAAGILYAAWKDGDGDPPGRPNRVVFSRSSDGGRSWSGEAPIPQFYPGTGVRQSDPWLIEAAGTLYLSWSETGAAGERALGVTTSTDGGSSWSTPSNAHLYDERPDKPMIAIGDDGALYMVYKLIERGGRSGSVIVARSLDGGASWPDTTRVSSGDGNVALPAIATLPGGGACAFWADFRNSVLIDDPYEIMSSCSRDSGDSWDTETVLASAPGGPGYLFQGGPVAATSGQTLFLSWIGDGFEVLVARSDDGGNSWSDPIAANDATHGQRWQPTLATGEDGRLHLTWYDSRRDDIHVAHSYSDDSGDTWARDLRVTTEPTPANLTPVGPPTWEGTRLGDYMGLVVLPDAAVVLFTDWRGANQDIMSARIDR